MEPEQVWMVSGLCRAAVYFLSALGMGICFYRRRGQRGGGPEHLLLLGLLTVGSGTLLTVYWGGVGPAESWGRVLSDLVLVNAGTAVTVVAMYLLTVRFHLVTLALKKEAQTDPLTGLYNRRTFFRELGRRLERGGSFAVAVLDLDNMKEINDTLGHQVGDAVLEAAARAIKKSIREEDIAARYGGDEFAILFARSGPRTEKFRARLRENLLAELPYTAGVDVGISVGLARYPQDGRDASFLLSVADARMYAEKEAKKRYTLALDLRAGEGGPPGAGTTWSTVFVEVEGGDSSFFHKHVALSSLTKTQENT